MLQDSRHAAATAGRDFGPGAGIAVRKGETELVNQFNAAIDAIVRMASTRRSTTSTSSSTSTAAIPDKLMKAAETLPAASHSSREFGGD